MTDGEDASSLTPAVLVQNFKDILRDSWTDRPLSVHAIGFGTGCARDFLTGLLSCGNVPGSFRYAEPADNDDTLCQKLTGVFEVCSKQSSVDLSVTGFVPITLSSAVPAMPVMPAMPAMLRFPIDNKGWGTYKCWISLTNGVPTEVQINSEHDHASLVPVSLSGDTGDGNAYKKWISTLVDDLATKVLQLSEKGDLSEVCRQTHAQLLLKYLSDLEKACPEYIIRTEFMREQITGWLAGQALSLGKLGDLQYSTLFGAPKPGSLTKRAIVGTQVTLPAITNTAAVMEQPLKYYSRVNTGQGRNTLQEYICDAVSRKLAKLPQMTTLADLIYTDNDGNNAIMLAAYCGHSLLLEGLLKLHRDVSPELLNKANNDGETATTLCIKKSGYHDSLMVLIGAGASIPTVRMKGLERYCFDRGYLKTVKLLGEISSGQATAVGAGVQFDSSMSKDYILYAYGQARASNTINAENVMQYLVAFLSKLMVDEAKSLLEEHPCPPLFTLEHVCQYGVPPKPDHPDTDKYLKIAEIFLSTKPELLKQLTTDRETILHVATRQGSLPHVKYFLDLGAQVDVGDSKGNSALTVAVNMRFPCIVDELLERGASVEWRNANGHTPLYGACVRGPLKIVEKLVSYGADVTNCSGSDDTTILVACRNGQSEVLRYLLCYVDMTFTNRKASIDGFSSVMSAAESDHANCITVLHEYGVDISQRTDADNKILAEATPLHIAAYYGRERALTELLRLGASPNCVDRNGSTPLHVVTIQGYPQIVRLLLEAGAIADMLDLAGNAAISYCRDQVAIRTQLIDPVTETLIKMGKGAYPTKLQDELVTILREAVCWHWPYRLQFIDARDEDGNTPLICATIASNIAIVSMLLEVGANANISDRDSCSPLFWALHNKVPRLSALLVPQTNQQIQDTTQDQVHRSLGAGPFCFLGVTPPYYPTKSAITARMVISKALDGIKTKRMIETMPKNIVMMNTLAKDVAESSVWWNAKVITIRKVASGLADVFLMHCSGIKAHATQHCMALALYSNGITKALQRGQELRNQYERFLLSTLLLLPAYDGETFLGVAQINREDFVLGTEFALDQFMSTSTLWRVAMENTPSFISKSRRGTIFAVQSKTGRSISSYSQYPYDSEVVFLPGTCFKVTGWYHGHVIALGQPNIRAHSYNVKEQDEEWLPLAEMITSDKSLIIELTEVV